MFIWTEAFHRCRIFRAKTRSVFAIPGRWDKSDERTMLSTQVNVLDWSSLCNLASWFHSRLRWGNNAPPPLTKSSSRENVVLGDGSAGVRFQNPKIPNPSCAISLCYRCVPWLNDQALSTWIENCPFYFYVSWPKWVLENY